MSSHSALAFLALLLLSVQGARAQASHRPGAAEGAAAERICLSGGNVDRDGSDGDGDSWSVDLSAVRQEDLREALAAATSLDRVTSLDLGQLKDPAYLSLRNTNVSSAGLSGSRLLPRVRELDLFGTRTGGRVPLAVARSSALESLSLGPGVTDEALRALAGSRSLRRLDLSHSSVTNAGVDLLTGLTNLRDLDLSNTAVGDGLTISRNKFPSLRRLSLVGDDVTPHWCAQLRQWSGDDLVIVCPRQRSKR
jgi:hypothetical protein